MISKWVLLFAEGTQLKQSQRVSGTSGSGSDTKMKNRFVLTLGNERGGDEFWVSKVFSFFREKMKH